MNLKNYTSDMPFSRSINKIESCLVQAGATNISKKYDKGTCVAIMFRMVVNNNPIFFQLPANVDACYKSLLKSLKKNKNGEYHGSVDLDKWKSQAERTAWKIICDWVEVQLSMILLEQAETIEVFLPYVYDPAKDETFFQKLKGNNFKQLTY